MMKCQEVREEEKQNIQERFSLAIARIQAMEEEETVPQPYRDFFRKAASYILWAGKQTDLDYTEYSLEELQQMNQEAYEDILPEGYPHMPPDSSAAAPPESIPYNPDPSAFLPRGYMRLLSGRNLYKAEVPSPPLPLPEFWRWQGKSVPVCSAFPLL